MDYFKILNLNKEPFSNSPDPEYFFQSRQHRGCLQKLELSIRLRRGLNVVIGDVGTGKTTLCRQLIRGFSRDDEYETHLILDPYFKDSSDFLTFLVGLFKERKIKAGVDEWKLKEIIKNHIFRKGVDEKKTVVLIIDEGQKIPLFCLELLREFLNYETNENKLLQIVIFAQKEFEKTLSDYQNFADRINLYHLLEPLNFKDTRRMIKFRIKQSSVEGKTPVIFSYPALWAIYRTTAGYPRRIINLCHQCILAIIIQNRSRVGWFLVRSCFKRSFPRMFKKRRRITFMTTLIICLVAVLAAGLSTESFKVPAKQKIERLLKADINNGKILQKLSVPKKTGAGNEKKGTADIVEDKLMKPVQKAKVEQNTQPNKMPVKEDIHKVAEKKSETENTIPAVLGRVALKKRETLWRLVEKVYGVYKYKYMKALKKANPDIINPDNVEAGSVIYLPAIPAKVTPLSNRVWWVKIGEKDRLEKGINLLRSYPEDAPPICLIPYWNSISGLKFAVLLKGFFYDSATAAGHLVKLPESFAGKGKVISFWEKGTVFFSDPFFQMGG